MAGDGTGIPESLLGWRGRIPSKKFATFSHRENILSKKKRQELSKIKEDEMSRRINGFEIVGLLFLSLLVLFAVQACQKAEKAEAQATRPKTAVTATAPVQTAAAPAPDFYSILGKAEAQESGAFDVQKGDGETLVAYHYYVTDVNDFDKGFGQHLAPRIRTLYRELKDIDQVAFDVYVPTEGEEPWRPYVHFAVTRKIMEETDWTKLLDADFFQVVQDLKYSD
jgi:hypothetical protein